mmetsp:Transcript_24187/g.35831  ORF Transcript_24187/g.35831 Transcript_24187/m.35831 type:complete len:514 (+) Transcript_24187:782-2323(+)
MSNFQNFDFASDFEQQSAVIIQASLRGFITRQQHLYERQIPDYAARCIQDFFRTLRDTSQFLEHDIYLTDNLIQQTQPSNQEEATIMERVSCIFDNYYTYYQCGRYVKAWKCSKLIKLYLAKYAKLLEVTIQQHKRATKIQACFRGLLSRKQHRQKFIVLPNPVSQQGHVKEMFHVDNLLRNSTNDFDAISNDLHQLLDSSRDKHPDHDLLWPRHGPDPVFQRKQANLPVDCYVDLQLTTTPSYDKQHGTSYHDVSARRFFDPGGITISKTPYEQKIIVATTNKMDADIIGLLDVEKHGTSYYDVSARRLFDPGGTKHLHYATDPYKRILTNDKSNAYATNVLDTVLAEKGDFFKATEVFHRVREVSGDTILDTLLNLGHLYLAQKKYPEALQSRSTGTPITRKSQDDNATEALLYIAFLYFDWARQTELFNDARAAPADERNKNCTESIELAKKKSRKANVLLRYNWFMTNLQATNCVLQKLTCNIRRTALKFFAKWNLSQPSSLHLQIMLS